MNPRSEDLRAHLERRELNEFIIAFNEHQNTGTLEIGVAQLTQRVLPTVLRQAFAEGTITSASVVLLWRLVRSSKLLLVDNDLLEAINLRIDKAVHDEYPGTVQPVPPLVTFKDLDESSKLRSASAPQSGPRRPRSDHGDAVAVKRISVASSFTVSTWSVSDAFDFRKNLCASGQEHAFLQAARQYFPNMRVYPNVAVHRRPIGLAREGL